MTPKLIKRGIERHVLLVTDGKFPRFLFSAVGKAPSQASYSYAPPSRGASGSLLSIWGDWWSLLQKMVILYGFMGVLPPTWADLAGKKKDHRFDVENQHDFTEKSESCGVGNH